jgi:hypothetical protein
MAYSRWGLNADWYIFWETTKAETDAAAAGRPKPKHEERLAVWRAKLKPEPYFTYAEIQQILTSEDFSRVPGFDEESRELLRDCFTAFIQDVDEDRT